MGDDGKLGAILAIEAALQGSRQGARARARQDVSDALRSSALRLFLERGFDGATVSEIAERAGVTPRTFFRYFQTKETVIVEVLDETNSRLVELVHRFAPGVSVAHGLRESIRQWFAEVEELMAVVADFVESSPSLNAALLYRQREWELRVGEAIQQSHPGMTAQSAQLWGVLAYALLRIIFENANSTDVTYSDAIDAVFDDFARETQRP